MDQAKEAGQGMTAHPKPEPHARVKACTRREHAKARAECREVVYRRAQGRCEACGVPLVLSPAHAMHEFDVAHIHEVRHRSQGGDDTDPDNCRCLCWLCHQEAHAHRA